MTLSAQDFENAAAESLKTRLAAAFIDIDVEHIGMSVELAYRRFDGCRIRLQVPLLVEHAVRDEPQMLRTAGVRAPRLRNE